MIKPSQVKEGWTSHVDGVFRSVAGRSLRCCGSGCCASSNPVIVERSYPYIAVQNGYVKYRFSGNLENHAAVCVLDEVPKSYVKPAMKTLVKACIGEGAPPYVILTATTTTTTSITTTGETLLPPVLQSPTIGVCV